MENFTEMGKRPNAKKNIAKGENETKKLKSNV